MTVVSWAATRFASPTAIMRTDSRIASAGAVMQILKFSLYFQTHVMRHSIASQGSPISKAPQIRALSSPARQDILDAVTAIGPCSVAELAAAVGKPADGLYYHIRQLLEVGLLVETRDDGAERGELRLDAAHKALYLEYKPDNRSNKAAVLRVIAS